MMKNNAISTREKSFANNWLSNGQNALQAYKHISPKATDKTAGVEGAKYLKKPRVQEYIKVQLEKTSDKLEITRESQIIKLSKLYNEEAERVSDKLSIIQEQNKLLGLYSPEVRKNINYDQELTDEERRALLAATNEEIG